MPYADAAIAIRGRLIALWPATPIAIENEPFTLPDPPRPFLHLSIRGGPALQASLGAPDARLMRREGSVRVTVLAPTLAGTANARRHADAVAGLFEARRFSGVQCRAASIGDASPFGRDGAWWQLPISIPFYFDEALP
jgi:hypothetical protein